MAQVRRESRTEKRVRAMGADDIVQEIHRLEDRVANLDKVLGETVHLYNLGYHAGHEATVEGCYTHIYQRDMRDYHDDIVAEILSDAGYKHD
jgi:hypothetical protein